jgi:uncharacterized membrane protein
MAVVQSDVIAIAGLGFDFLGAVLLVRGLLKQQATIVRHITKDTDLPRKRSFHKKFALSVAQRWLSSRDVMDANPEPLVDSLSGLVWATIYLCLGFGLQILSYVIGWL